MIRLVSPFPVLMFLASVCLLGSFSAPARAEDPTTKTVATPPANPSSGETLPDIPKPLAVMPTKIKPLQDNPDDMAKAAPDNHPAAQTEDAEKLETAVPDGLPTFPKSFTENTDRGSLVAFLSSPVGFISSYGSTATNLLKKAILTPAENISSSSDPAENLYALRLKKLVETGDFSSGLLLAKMNDGTPPTPLAARAGIESMLGKGEMAVACLEQNALPDTLKTDSPAVRDNIDTFCQALLGPAAGDDDALRLGNASRVFIDITKTVPPASIDALNATDIVTALALMKSGKVAGLLTTPESYAALSNRNLALCLSFCDAKSPSFLMPSGEALRRGLLTTDAALPILFSIENPPEKTGKDSLFIREFLKSAPPLATAPLLALATENRAFRGWLLPLYAAEEQAVPEDNPRLSLIMLLKANRDIPPALVYRAFGVAQPNQAPDKNAATHESGESLLISRLEQEISSLPAPEKAKKSARLEALKPFISADSGKIGIYDNILSLTVNSDYVMPMGDILSNLRKSAEKKQADQVVINSLSALAAAPPERLNPAVLYEVLKALNSAGLKEETLSLSRFVLGDILENK